MSDSIGSLMNATMENIRGMVDVNTVVGAPVTTEDGGTIIPISRVSFGFVAGGGEYGLKQGSAVPTMDGKLPFSGGSGAGVTVSPVGFLVVNGEQVKMLPAQTYAAPIDRVIELAPQIISDVKAAILAQSAGKRKGKHASFTSATAEHIGHNPEPAGTDIGGADVAHAVSAETPVRG